jgi:hypothetical protein
VRPACAGELVGWRQGSASPTTETARPDSLAADAHDGVAPTPRAQLGCMAKTDSRARRQARRDQQEE